MRSTLVVGVSEAVKDALLDVEIADSAIPNLAKELEHV